MWPLCESVRAKLEAAFWSVFGFVLASFVRPPVIGGDSRPHRTLSKPTMYEVGWENELDSIWNADSG